MVWGSYGERRPRAVFAKALGPVDLRSAFCGRDSILEIGNIDARNLALRDHRLYVSEDLLLPHWVLIAMLNEKPSGIRGSAPVNRNSKPPNFF